MRVARFPVGLGVCSSRPDLIALSVHKTPQRNDLQYVVLRVEMRCINPEILCRRSCGEREAPTFSLATLNVKYGQPTRNFNYSELPSEINAALEATGHPNVPDPQGTPGDLIIYPGPTGRAETFLPGGNATARALYERNFARAGLQINAPTATGPHLHSTVPVRRGSRRRTLARPSSKMPKLPKCRSAWAKCAGSLKGSSTKIVGAEANVTHCPEGDRAVSHLVAESERK
jgi:hypothetical protein